MKEMVWQNSKMVINPTSNNDYFKLAITAETKSKSKLEHWFGVPMYFSELEQIDNTKIINYSKKIIKKDKGRVLSNYGGWQSNDYHLHDCENEELKKLASIVEQKMRDFSLEIGLKPEMQINMSNFWININSKGNSNHVHTHPNSFFAAVYYVKTPENCGRLQIQNPFNFVNFWWQSYTDTETYSTYTSVNVTPSPGRLVIFPSWLPHYVEQNQSNEQRISVALNAFVGNK